jgi:hypothetical protein
MARVTVDDIYNIIDTTDEDMVEACISSANVFVTATLVGKGLTDPVLKEIERWLTGHMIASTKERQIKKAGAGGAEVEYVGKFDIGLYGTSYGQMAVALDTSGTLVALAKGKGQAWTYSVPTSTF